MHQYICLVEHFKSQFRLRIAACVITVAVHLFTCGCIEYIKACTFHFRNRTYNFSRPHDEYAFVFEHVRVSSCWVGRRAWRLAVCFIIMFARGSQENGLVKLFKGGSATSCDRPLIDCPPVSYYELAQAYPVLNSVGIQCPRRVFQIDVEFQKTCSLNPSKRVDEYSPCRLVYLVGRIHLVYSFCLQIYSGLKR